MSAEYLKVIEQALAAAEFGEEPEDELVQLLKSGSLNYPIEDLEYDSLQTMEFCISIELSTGAQFTEAVFATCTMLSDVGDWIADQSNSSESPMAEA